MATMADAFFTPSGDGFVATEHTRGPWSPKHQHGGPPSALMAYLVECETPEFAVARVTVDFLRPVPIDRLVVRLETLRAGTKVRRVAATLAHGDGAVAYAVFTLIRVAELDGPRAVTDPSLPPPEGSPPFQFPFFLAPGGYHTAMESRLARGEWGSGRAALWMRQRIPLLAGVAATPVTRVLLAADSGSGVSAAIEHRTHTAVNADLTVHLHRALEGEWVGLDSISTYERTGVGLADTRMHDTRGPVGRALQSLVVEERA
jgi:acyl-Coa thioesterase superfamily protein/acyl-CoA thioesterase superfamily protein